MITKGRAGRIWVFMFRGKLEREESHGEKPSDQDNCGGGESVF
jgi:hypothetical protein